MPRLTLTDATLRSLKPATRQTFFDAATPGFAVRVSPRGARTFVIVYGPEKARRWEKIGAYPLVSLARAREKARTRLSMIQLGIKPAEPELPFAEAYAQFLAYYEAKNRAKTVYEMQRIAKRHFLPKLGKKMVGDITTTDLTGIFDKLLPTPAECAATFTAARTLFSWLARRRAIERSPLDNVPQPRSRSARTRVLSDDEVRAIWTSAEATGNLNPEFCKIVKLLILTGQRKGQIGRLRGEWYDRDRGRIAWPAEAMKGGRAHVLPAAAMAKAVLDALPRDGFAFLGRGGRKPFNGYGKCKAAFEERAAIPPWTLHDLRRTFSTGIAKLGVPPHIKEMILAHATAKDPVEAIYDLHTYEPEMRDAMRRWESHLQLLFSTEETV